VYAFVRRRHANSHDAQELTQAFFADLLERRSIGVADPARGRFRSFLATALKNFLANERAKAATQKRGGGKRLHSLDLDAAETLLQAGAVDGNTPEREFERRWAVALLERAIDRLATNEAEAGRRAQFETLRLFLTGQNGDTTCAEAGRRLAMSEVAVRAAVHRLRKRYRSLLREEIRQTVNSADEVEDELRQLFAAIKS
jgi:RNA polymerase sigma-70 factor (ECF subfamily)